MNLFCTVRGAFTQTVQGPGNCVRSDDIIRRKESGNQSSDQAKYLIRNIVRIIFQFASAWCVYIQYITVSSIVLTQAFHMLHLPQNYAQTGR